MINPPVFFGAAGSVLAFIIFGAFYTSYAAELFNKILDFITRVFGWYYILIVTLILVFTIYLLFSKYGNIKLGGF